MKQIAIIEDDYIIAKLLQQRIDGIDGFQCSGKYPGPVSFLSAEVKADIILLDISMPEMNGVDSIPLILNKLPNVLIIIISIEEDINVVFKALQLGAVGYINKQSTEVEFYDLISCVEKGGAYMTPAVARKVVNFFQSQKSSLNILTDREREVAGAILDGLSYKLIAYKLYISIDTVRMHVKNIYKKMKINSKSELFRLFK
jgi:DNA-binding NarL/FixJ family response regulator